MASPHWVRGPNAFGCIAQSLGIPSPCEGFEPQAGACCRRQATLGVGRFRGPFPGSGILLVSSPVRQFTWSMLDDGARKTVLRANPLVVAAGGDSRTERTRPSGPAVGPGQGLRGARPAEGREQDLVGHPHRIAGAIDRVEQAWSLARDPKVAIQLATMYDRVNRNEDALVVLREASHNDPSHPMVRIIGHNAAPARSRRRHPGFLRQRAEDRFRRRVCTIRHVAPRQLRRLGRRAGLGHRSGECGTATVHHLVSGLGTALFGILRPLCLRGAALAGQSSGIDETVFCPCRDLHVRRDRETTFAPIRCSPV